jgi:hypothetical protein
LHPAAEVAITIAIREPCCDFAQVALADWLAAHRAERLRSRSPAIHQDESHVSPPDEMRDASGDRGWSAQWNVSRIDLLELKKSIDLLQIEGSFTNIDITDIFGIAGSHIALEASAVPPSGTITHR